MLKTTLVKSLVFLKNHAAPLSWVIVPIALVSELLTGGYRYFAASDPFSPTNELIVTLIEFLIHPVYVASIVFYVAAAFAGQGITSINTWKLAIRNWPRYCVMSVLICIVSLLGLIALVIPGLILVARFGAADFFLLLHNQNPLNAMKNSWRLTRDYVWTILGGYVVIWAVPAILLLPVTWSVSAQSPFNGALDILFGLVFFLIAAMNCIFTFHIYTFAQSQSGPSPNTLDT